MSAPISNIRPEPDALLVDIADYVLSTRIDSTEAYDRGEKWAHYRRLASLRDYVLVSQHTARIELYSREGDHWVLREAGPGKSLALTGLTGALALDRVYAGITLDPPPPTPV